MFVLHIWYMHACTYIGAHKHLFSYSFPTFFLFPKYAFCFKTFLYKILLLSVTVFLAFLLCF